MARAKKQAGLIRKSNRPNRSSASQADAEERPQRIPLAKARGRLTVKGMQKDRHYRWVADIGNGTRIRRFKDAGYRIETDETLEVGENRMAKTEGLGSPVTQHYGFDEQGKAIVGYLMSTRQEWFEEDQIAKELEILDLEKSFIEPQKLQEQGFYKKTIEIDDDTAGKRVF